jgi:GT2 family glycosyltransferase
MRDIPVLILANEREAACFLNDCLKSLSLQIGRGTEYDLSVFVGLYGSSPEKNRLNFSEAFTDLSVKYIEIEGERLGYGQKQNMLFENIRTLDRSFFITMNPDMVLMPDCIRRLVYRFDKERDAFIVEARQFPVENPSREFDRIHGDVDWCSGACILIQKDFFEKCGGFDERIFLYCEDVELSWRAWLMGGRCIYEFDAIVSHLTSGLYEARYNPHTVQRHERQMAISHLILMWKYFGADQRRYADLQAMYMANGWLSQPTKLQALTQMEKLKPLIDPLQHSHPRVNIFDVGLYSRMRAGLI